MRKMIKLFLALLLIFSSTIVMARPGVPTHVGDCRAAYIERTAIKRVAYVMGVPQHWITETIIFCDPWTQLPGTSLTFQQIGQDTVDCSDRRVWTWLVGCINGTVIDNRFTIILRMHPDAAQLMIDTAKQQGMSLGSRTEEEIRCFYGLESHIVGLVIHEWNHKRGYKNHDEIMAAEDNRLIQLYMQRYGGWVRENEWSQC